jgi:hypothetical protein
VQYASRPASTRLARAVAPVAGATYALLVQILEWRITVLLMVLATLYAMFFFDIYIVSGADARWDMTVYAMNAVVFSLFLFEFAVPTAYSNFLKSAPLMSLAAHRSFAGELCCPRQLPLEICVLVRRYAPTVSS